MWGNMWSAKCDYIKRLVSPFDLEAKNRVAVRTKPAGMTMNFYGTQEAISYALGQGRFAAEQFVTTHPTLIPCSFTKPEDAINAFWIENPKGAFENHVIHGENPVNLQQDMLANNNHLKEWFLLPGILWRYHVLYGELPPEDSWIWRHYPDGENWKQLIQQVGFPNALFQRIASAS